MKNNILKYSCNGKAVHTHPYTSTIQKPLKLGEDPRLGQQASNIIINMKQQ